MFLDRRNWRGVAIALGLLAAASAGAASAGVVYESATYTSLDTGDYILSNNDLIGASFTVAQTTHVTGIGAQFGDPFDPNPGTIFGAIVPLAALSAFPAGSSDDLASISLADVVFSVPSGSQGDVVVPVSATLAPGAYAVIFGAGQFGSDADGFAAIGDDNNPVGSPTLIRSFFSTGWESFDDTGVRLDVQGAVPEPATWGLMIAGFGGMGALLRRKNRKAAISAA